MIKVQVNKENWKKVSPVAKMILSCWLIVTCLFVVMATTPLRHMDYTFQTIMVSHIIVSTICAMYLIQDILKKKKQR